MLNLTSGEYVQRSLDLNLFFLRIMKEHSFFIAAAFVPKNNDLATRADRFKDSFTVLLSQAVDMANGNVSSIILNSGEVVTDKTLRAEEKTQFLSGVPLDTALTVKEAQLRAGAGNPALEGTISSFNERVITETTALVDFKTQILKGMLECSLFTWNFPLLIEHIRREALFFITHLKRLQQRIALDPTEEIIEEKVFWDRIMAEHSLFIAHLLDPTETSLIMTANGFADKFYKLESRARLVEEDKACVPHKLLDDELKATQGIRDFKNTAEELILACQIRSVIIPLLADHVLREANHFFTILTHTNAPIKDFFEKNKSFKPLISPFVNRVTIDMRRK